METPSQRVGGPARPGWAVCMWLLPAAPCFTGGSGVRSDGNRERRHCSVRTMIPALRQRQSEP